MFLFLIPSVVHIARTADIFCLGFFKAALQNQLVYHYFIESQHFGPPELHQVQTFCLFTWPDVGQLDGNVVIQEERSAAVFHRVCVCLCVCEKFCVCMHTLQLVCDSHSEGFAFCIFSWLLFVFGNSFQPCIHISYYYNVEDNIYLKRSVISTLIHLTPGVSWGGWSVISLLTCSLEHRMMERRSVRAFLKVIEPPMALRVLKRPSNTFLFVLNTTNPLKKIKIHLHFSDCIPHTTEFGEFINAFFLDYCAVHIKADSFSSPEELLCLRQRCHHAGKLH